MTEKKKLYATLPGGARVEVTAVRTWHVYPANADDYDSVETFNTVRGYSDGTLKQALADFASNFDEEETS